MFLTILREGYRDIPCTICPSYAYSFLFLTLTELPPQPPPHSDPLVTLSVLTVVHMTLRYFSLFAWFVSRCKSYRFTDCIIPSIQNGAWKLVDQQIFVKLMSKFTIFSDSVAPALLLSCCHINFPDQKILSLAPDLT